MLFEEVKLGELTLKNRMIMSPLTRCRAGKDRIPGDLMAEYYSQRASFGLIISEATSVTPSGLGYPHTPGIWNEEQVEGWKKITEAVHKKGGKIFLQLWHVGRISDPIYLNGNLPIAPSAVKPAGTVSLVRPKKEFETPRALEISEIKEIVSAFKKGAENAKLAGFDGVEIHGANGYLLDQFLQTGTNKREDEYGGSLENRMRFPLEVLDSVLSVWSKDMVGYHIAPRCDAHDMSDENPKETFSALMREFKKREIAFVFARSKQSNDDLNEILKKEFGGFFIANQGLTKEVAEEVLNSKKADAIAFGVLAIANPDLPNRFQNNLPLNKPNVETFYAFDEKGYTDYK